MSVGLGDVIEIETKSGFAYAQLTHDILAMEN